MANQALEFFQANIGQTFAQSPSPLSRWLGGMLLQAEEGMLEASFVVREEMTNPMGTLHGGTISAICDDLIGATTFTLGREYFYTSINLNVDFLASARLGETVIAKATLVRAGQTIIHADCTLRDAEGKLLAKAASNLMRVNVPIKKAD